MKSSDSNRIQIEDRISLALGICRVLSSLPQSQRIESFKAFVSPTLDWLISLTQIVQLDKQIFNKDTSLEQIGDEMQLLSSMVQEFAAAITKEEMGNQAEIVDRAQIPTSILEIIQRAWTSISFVASHCADHEVNSSDSITE